MSVLFYFYFVNQTNEHLFLSYSIPLFNFMKQTHNQGIEALSRLTVDFEAQIKQYKSQIQFRNHKQRAQKTYRRLIRRDLEDIVHEPCPQPKEQNGGNPATGTPTAIPTPPHQILLLLLETRFEILPFDGISACVEKTPLLHLQSRRLHPKNHSRRRVFQEEQGLGAQRWDMGEKGPGLRVLALGEGGRGRRVVAQSWIGFGREHSHR